MTRILWSMYGAGAGRHRQPVYTFVHGYLRPALTTSFPRLRSNQSDLSSRTALRQSTVFLLFSLGSERRPLISSH